MSPVQTISSLDVRQLPKTELHLHLDCSLSYRVASSLDPSLSQEQYNRLFVGPEKCRDLADYLQYAPYGIALMQTEEGLRQVTEDLFYQLQKDNVIYAEIRFAPLLHLEQGLEAAEVVQIVEAAAAKISRKTGIRARLILCTLRHYTREQSLITAQLVEQFQGTLVAALDIAADEAGFPIDAHIDAFQYAQLQNLPRTAHAGEAKGAESVLETLKYFHPTRIGHGVRSIEDPELIQQLIKTGIHLEVCPTSNIQVNVFDRYENHPVNRLYEAGLSIGINTDTRTITNITLNQEYQKLQEVFGWQKEHFLTCNRNSIASSFLPDLEKRQLQQELEQAYQKF